MAVRVQTHPSRHRLIKPLVAKLGAFEDLRVIPDPRPDGGTDSWRSHRACLESATATATHLLVLQDDALPAQLFAQKVAVVLAEQPDRIVALFTPGFRYLQKQMREAQTAGLAFTPMRTGAFVPVVAICYPRQVVTDVLEWADSRWNEQQKRNVRGADDGVIALFCRQTRVEPLLLVPSIVEHDDSIESIGKYQRRTGSHRRAALL